MSEWQPIGTAPKDQRILLWWPKHQFGSWVEIGKWDSDQYAKRPRPYWSGDGEKLLGRNHYRSLAPTHWMAIPEPPSTGG